MSIVLLIVAFICAVNWLKWKVITMAMVYYIQKNGYKLPSEQETKECTQFVVKNLFKHSN